MIQRDASPWTTLLSGVLAIVLIAATSGCSTFEVGRLADGPAPAPTPPKPSSRLHSVVRVEKVATTEPDAILTPRHHLEGQLALALNGSFARVIGLEASRVAPDLIARGRVTGSWDPNRGANFASYFPGGLIFAPGWYGTQMRYAVEATVELVDARSGHVEGRYQAATEYEMTYGTWNPFHFLGALIIVPGVIRGSLATFPRGLYKRKVYAEAYPDLWRQIAEQIVAERAPIQTAALEERRQQCGVAFDQPPAIGLSWPEFRSCQSQYYFETDAVKTGRGVATIYQNPKGQPTLFVIDDQIIDWQAPLDRSERRARSDAAGAPGRMPSPAPATTTQPALRSADPRSD